MQPLKLAIISTHPVQYYAPVFRGLAQTKQVQPRVFYTWSQSSAGPVPDAGFGIAIEWDLPLLDGYEHEFVANVAARPGLQHFFGVRTPSLVSRIAAWGADAVLVYGWNLAAHFGAMRALKGRIPVFFRGDSTLLDEQPRLRRLARRAALAAIYRNIDVAISVGSNSRDYYRWCGVADSNIEFAPHSVDTARFAAKDAERDADALRLRDRNWLFPRMQRCLRLPENSSPRKIRCCSSMPSSPRDRDRTWHCSAVVSSKRNCGRAPRAARACMCCPSRIRRACRPPIDWAMCSSCRRAALARPGVSR